MPGQVGLDHLGDHVGKAGGCGPAEFLLGLGGVAEQDVDFGGAHVAWIDPDLVGVVEADMLEGEAAEVADAGGDAGCDHVVVGVLLLQHEVHGLDVVAGVAPVAGAVEVAEREVVGQAQLDAGGAVGDLAGDELDAAEGTFVVEQDAAACVEAEALAVIDRHPVGIELGDAVGAAWVEGGALVLAGFLALAEHLAAADLVGAGGGKDQAHGLEQVAGAEGGDVAGEQRLLPACGDETLGGEIVDFVRLGVVKDAEQAADVGEVAVDELDLVEDAQPAEALADHVGAGAAAQQADHAVALAQEKLCEIRAILAGDAGDQGCGHGAPCERWTGKGGGAVGAALDRRADSFYPCVVMPAPARGSGPDHDHSEAP